MNNTAHFQKGFGVVEVLVAVVIISVVLVGLHSASVRALQLIQQSTRRTQAAFLAEEAVEAVRSFRDAGWSTTIAPLSTGVSYYLEWDGGAWVATSTNIFIDGTFERAFMLKNVYRDTNDDIAPTGTLDAGTKLLTVTTAWRSQTGTTTETIQTYITDLFNN